MKIAGVEDELRLGQEERRRDFHKKQEIIFRNNKTSLVEPKEKRKCFINFFLSNQKCSNYEQTEHKRVRR